MKRALQDRPPVAVVLAAAFSATLISACAASGFTTVWRAWPSGLRYIAILPTPILVFFAPLLLLFVTQFPRRGSARRKSLTTAHPTSDAMSAGSMRPKNGLPVRLFSASAQSIASVRSDAFVRGG
jgi:hypothetical protein